MQPLTPAERLVRAAQHGRRDPRVVAQKAGLLEEQPYGVLRAPVLLRRCPHRLRDAEPVALPGEAAGQCPVEDAGELLAQLCGERREERQAGRGPRAGLEGGGQS